MRVLRPAVAFALVISHLGTGVDTRRMVVKCIPGPPLKFLTKSGVELDCNTACGQDRNVKGCGRCCPVSKATKSESKESQTKKRDVDLNHDSPRGGNVPNKESQTKKTDVDPNPNSPGGGKVPIMDVYVAVGVILSICLLSMLVAGFISYKRGQRRRLGAGPERGPDAPDQQAEPETVPLQTFAKDVAKPETGPPGRLYSASQENLANATWSR